MPIATPQGTLDFKSVDTITFVGASSNTVIDTTTGSLGVGVDGNGPTSNLHVVGDALITGNVSDLNIVSNVNMLHTSNTAALKLNSNVVTEFPRSKKLIKYPRVAMTGPSTPTGYVVSASTALGSGWEPYRAFNTIAGEEEGWHDEGSTYSTGVYIGSNSVTPVTGSAVEGEWIQIQLPEKIKLEKIRLAPRTTYNFRMPKDATILGSINGTDWYRVTSWSGQTYLSGNNYATIDVDSEQYYNYYVLVVESLDAAGNSVNIGEWELFGVPEYDPEADGVDVVVKSVPNVPNTDWLEVYYDAKDLVDGAVSTTAGAITGLGGTTNNGTAFGDPQVSNGAFVLDGVDDYITTGPLGFSGDQPYSISIWFRSDRPQTDMTTENGIYGFGYGNNLNGGLSWWSPVTNGASSLRHWHSGSGGKNFPYVTFLEDMWNHVVIVYPGGGAFNIRAWLNGVERMGVNNPGNSTNNDFSWSTSDNIIIGDWYTSSGPRLQSPWDGKIANFRLFNRALTTDEIWQLYAYQKEDFGHGDLSMTLKAGRLGIGTSEPRAALDVRGDVHISGSLRKTRARMIRLESGAKHFTLDGWQTYVSYGEAWTAYSSDPLYSISITGDYVATARAINYRIAVQNQRTDEVLYFPSSSGWIKYHYVDNTRLDGHGYLGIMSGLTFGDSYKVQLEVDPNSTNDYQWNTAYGTITGLVWD